MKTMIKSIICTLALLSISNVSLFAQSQGGSQPEFIRQGQQLAREGKLEEALAVYLKEIEASPNSVAAHNAAGVVLDLMGRGTEARKHFAKAIEIAPTPQAKANAQRQMGMSYAFDNDCQNTVRSHQQVFDYYVTQKDFYMQGEMANEAARVCIEAGDFNTAEKWYKLGHEVGLKEPNISADRVALWNFRLAHAQARLAARRNQKAAAQKYVAEAKAILDKNPEMAKQQAIFYPYLTGYVAYYTGDYKTALTEFLQANQNDAFIQTLIGQTYEKLGQQDKAMEYYRKASQVTSHNPPAAYARPFTRKKLGSQAGTK
ncbi:MAG TPA: tetratricopeptide repeat protein [Blastocatellia bacterium]|nr:tetratricopeptide repeat protein [Blastocatellia bacterium]